jgi:hypothetical protein
MSILIDDQVIQLSLFLHNDFQQHSPHNILDHIGDERCHRCRWGDILSGQTRYLENLSVNFRPTELVLTRAASFVMAMNQFPREAKKLLELTGLDFVHMLIINKV